MAAPRSSRGGASASALLLQLSLMQGAHANAAHAAAVGCDHPETPSLGPVIGQVSVRERPVLIYGVGDPVLGEPGESMDDFASRASTTFRDFTSETQKESCARICQTKEGPARFGVTPTTTLSAGACLVVDVCPEGMEPTEETIHTHGSAKKFEVCDTERAILGFLYRRGEVVAKESPEEFSGEDFAGAPGYLVSPAAVWHQAGKRHVRQLLESPQTPVIAVAHQDVAADDDLLSAR